MRRHDQFVWERSGKIERSSGLFSTVTLDAQRQVIGIECPFFVSLVGSFGRRIFVRLGSVSKRTGKSRRSGQLSGFYRKNSRGPLTVRLSKLRGNDGSSRARAASKEELCVTHFFRLSQVAMIFFFSAQKMAENYGRNDHPLRKI